MKNYFIQKQTTKYQQVTFVILERVAVEYNGVKGFQNEETGYEFKTEWEAKSRLNMLNLLNK